jgi:hypothetical protein
MPDVKVTGKKTITGEELGASEMAAVMMGVDAYGNTNQETLDNHKRAAHGVEVVKHKAFNKNALVRGTYLEHAIVPWFLEMLKDDGLTCTAEEPKDAFRMKEERLGATLDRIMTVPKDCEMVIGDNTFSGRGVLEVKTDFYHADKCKADWMIQLHQQMMCAGLEWGIVLVMTQKGKLKTYGYHKDDMVCQGILKAAREFWKLFDEDGEYPPVEKQPEPGLKTVTVEPKAGDNLDLVQVLTDYQKATAEARSWKKVADENKDILVMHMDSIDADVMNVGSFQVKSVTTQKPKRTMVEVPGEYIDSSSFSVKEVTND